LELEISLWRRVVDTGSNGNISLTKLIPVSDPIQTGVLYNGRRVIRGLRDHAYLVGLGK
jgi:hypothetical protein